MAKPKLLIVDDDAGLSSQYRWAFPDHEVLLAQSRTAALTVARAARPPLVILDLGLPPDRDGVGEGFATLGELQRLLPGAKIIIATGNGQKANALKAIASGAYDFCEKPVQLDVLRTILERALRLYELEEENRRLASPARSPIERIVTGDDTMLSVCRSVEKLARNNVPVLLLGESGTGKEALAQALHELGPRARHPFVAINCGAIPENLLESELFGHERGAFTGAVKQTIGKIESAHKGTLFLDEVGDLPHALQVKLLRFLQDQIVERVGGRQRIQVDVRIVSATNATLEDRVAAGTFRNDLLHRMNAVTLRVPPLKRRGGDIPLLAHLFLARFNRDFGRTIRGFTDAALAALSAHDWPGNVRELENRVKRALVMAEGTVIEPDDLELAPAAEGAVDLDLRTARMRAERDVIRTALARCNDTVAAAARLLGVSRPTLYGLMEMHGIAPSRGEGGEAVQELASVSVSRK